MVIAHRYSSPSGGVLGGLGVGSHLFSYPQPPSYSERCFWNKGIETYGRAARLKKTAIITVVTSLCLAVPFILPLWLVPIAVYTVPKEGYVWRWG